LTTLLDEPNEWCEKLSYVSGISNFAICLKYPKIRGNLFEYKPAAAKITHSPSAKVFRFFFLPLLLLSAVKCPQWTHIASAFLQVCVPGRELGTPKELNYISIRKKNTVSTMHSFY
jgi:hypothetical protein